MKNTKLLVAGLTTALTLSGAAAVFADDTTTTESVTATSEQQTETDAEDTTDTGEEGKEINGLFRMMRKAFEKMKLDMSNLELPDDFVPFDEAHVPDGKNAPINGELKPVEFDEYGNMTYGQRPEFEEGELPELPDGELPELPDGELPELPEGGAPVFMGGEQPVFSQGEMPGINNSMQGPQQGGMQFGGQNVQMPTNMF